MLADWYAQLTAPALAAGSPIAAVVRIGALWTAMLLASLLGGFAAVDGWIFDGLARIPPRPVLVAQVAVVSYPTPREGEHSVDLTELVGSIRAAGATDVALVVGDAASSGGNEPVTEGALPLDAPGAGCGPTADSGVARSLPRKGRDQLDCLITRLATQLRVDLPAGSRISPDFSIQSGTSLPALRAQHASSPALLRQIVSGRAVLVYPEPDPPVLVTPLYRDDGLMEASLLHALALDSLKKHRAVRWVQPPLDVLFAVVVIMLLHWRLRRSSYVTVLSYSSLSILAVVLASLGLLRLAHAYLPVTASVVAILAFVFHHAVTRNMALAQALLDIEHQLTGLVQRPLAASFSQPGDALWEHVNRFVVQFFDLRRSVMLRLPPGTFHLQPASWIGCLPGSIIEKRKDYRRTPFLAAIARGRPMRLEKPLFHPDAGMIDFLAPLVVAEHLVGFWAFSADAMSESELELLATEAAPYADEVAKVAFRSWETPLRRAAGLSERFFSLSKTRSRLSGVAQLAKEQLAAYRDVFSSVGHPIAVADLFGRIQFSNERFEQYALGVSKPLLAMSVQNILTQLCELSPAEAKDVLRRTLMERQAAQDGGLPIRIKDAPMAYSLHLKAVLRHDSEPSVMLASPFDVIGLVIELSPTVNPEISLAELTRAGNATLRRVTAGLQAMHRIAQGLPEGLRERDRLGDQLQVLLDETARLGKVLGAPDSHRNRDAVVVDLDRLLARARHDLMNEAAAKSVDITVETGPSFSVLVGPGPMRTLLADVLRLLIEDASPGTSLRIGTRTADDRLSLTVSFSNTGAGLPAAHVDDIMRQGGATFARGRHVTTLERVAAQARDLDPALALRLTSEAGRGFVVELQMPRN